MNLLAEILEAVITTGLEPSSDNRSPAPWWARVACFGLALAIVAWLVWG